MWFRIRDLIKRRRRNPLPVHFVVKSACGMKAGLLQPFDRRPEAAALRRGAARGPEGAPPEGAGSPLRGRPQAGALLRRGLRRRVGRREPLGPDPGRDRPRVLRLRRDGSPPRGRPQGRLPDGTAARLPAPRPPLRPPVGDLADAVHPLAPRPPRRARLDRGRPEAGPPLAEAELPLAEAPLRHARPLPDLLPGGPEGDRDLPGAAPADDRPRAARRDRPCTSASPPAIGLLGGWERLVWLWAVPVFLVFPPPSR